MLRDRQIVLPSIARAAGGVILRSLDVPCGLIATKMGWPRHVCFALDSDRTADIQDRQLRATSKHRGAQSSPARSAFN